MQVDFYRHGLSAADAAVVANVLDTPFLTTGRVCREVEAQLCAYFEVPHAVLTSSWTSGAMALLLAMGIGPGDEVIVPAMTFVASANIVELVGARTVLVDVEPDTFLMAPETAARAVTPRTKAVIPVHLYGRMIDVAGLRRALDAVSAPKQHIFIIEDCAHCFEGRRASERPGRHSDAAAFSFYATKNVTCGEGGAVICRDAGLYGRLLEARLHGMSASAIDRFRGGRYNHWDMRNVGVKANLPDLLAALLPAQIATIDKRLPERQALAARYRAAFADTPLRLPADIADCTDACHLFTIGVPASLRDIAITTLNEAGISVTVNFRALPDLTYYRERYPDAAAHCPNAIAWGRETISLPLYPGMPPDHQAYVIDVVRRDIVGRLMASRQCASDTSNRFGAVE
jgi:UDP-4-amino-4-deoxy-L-arabinose-oxoglutarate aminotransferase